MKKTKEVLLAFIIGIFLISCSNEVDDSYNGKFSTHYLGESGYSSETTIDEEIIRGVFTFSYKGQNYSSSYIINDKEKMILDDAQIQKQLTSFMDNSTLAILIHNQDFVEFFTNEKDMDESFKLRNALKFNLKRLDPYHVTRYQLRIWDKAKGRSKGGEWHHWDSRDYDLAIIEHPKDTWNIPPFLHIPNLASLNWDNKISSIQQWVEVRNDKHQLGKIAGEFYYVSMTFFEHPNYQGRSLRFTDVGVPSTYSYRDYFSSFGFDNITSSLKVQYHN